MATPLSPTNTSTLNISTPPTATKRYETSTYEVKTYTTTTTESGAGDDCAESSPFVSTVNDTVPVDQENIMSMSPTKNRHSRVLSGTELSPLKILAASEARSAADTASPRRLISPERRFPVKVGNLMETPRPASQTQMRDITIEEAIRENEGLRKAIGIFEDDDSVTENQPGHPQDDLDDDDEMACLDDTMVSTFSNFSAVPNMTMLARLGHSPTKFSTPGGLTPRAARPDPSSPARTPRAGTAPAAHQESGNTTNLLMDFTDQLRFPGKSPAKRGGGGTLPPSRTSPSIAGVPATPSRPFQNLIDFDIPPLPTPRSIPSVTPREVESIKSQYLSEISSLKAALNGKTAEADSLKAAVGDAEKRAGHSTEQLREERAAKETLSAEKEGWERRCREMETVLRGVKEEIVRSQREREELESKLDESEKRREAAEMMAQEAESKMAGMKAGKAAEESARNSPGKVKSPGGGNSSAKEVEMAVERVARELHALYKSKHETKVAALKKSYENRWEKKVRELEASISVLSDENEKLRLGRDATMTKVEPAAAAALDEERKEQAAKNQAQIKEMKAEVEKLEAVVRTVKGDNDSLRKLLESERVEKGELVQLAEELMSMQQSFVAPATETPARPAAPAAAGLRTPAHTRSQQVVENLRGSISRASGLRAPGSMASQESRIGRGIGHDRTKSGGLPRPGSIGMKSGLMGSIERMGNYRGGRE